VREGEARGDREGADPVGGRSDASRPWRVTGFQFQPVWPASASSINHSEHTHAPLTAVRALRLRVHARRVHRARACKTIFLVVIPSIVVTYSLLTTLKHITT